MNQAQELTATKMTDAYDPNGIHIHQRDPAEWRMIAPMNEHLHLGSLGNKLSSILSADLIDKGDQYVIVCDIPGMKKGDLDVTISNEFLRISGVREHKHKTECASCHKIERTSGKFERNLSLPKDADYAKATTMYENGVLCVHFPKLKGGKVEPIKLHIN